MITSTQPLRAILFDFVGVLLFPRAAGAVDPIASEIDGAIGQVTDDEAFKAKTLRKYRMYDAAFEAMLRKVVDRYAPFTPLWGLLPGLSQLYHLGIINNGTYLTYPFFEITYPLSQHFELFVSSAVEGIKKPDPAIYRRAAVRLGVTPGECLYMDDAAENVAGAQKAGMQAIHWENREAGFQHFLEFMRK